MRRYAVAHKFAGATAVRMSEQCHCMAAVRQAIDHELDDALDAAIEKRRYGNVGIDSNGDVQSSHWLKTRSTARSSAPSSSGCCQCQRRHAAAHAVLRASDS